MTERRLAWIVGGGLITVAVLCFAGAVAKAETTPLSCDGKTLEFHRHRANSILRHEYRITYYSTHRDAELRDYREHKLCIRHEKTKRKLSHRRRELAQFHRARIEATPYPGNGVYWAIPYYVVLCESGADYTWPIGLYSEGGAYGLRDSWWIRGGRKYADVASNAEPWQQDLIADIAWRAGDSWACA